MSKHKTSPTAQKPPPAEPRTDEAKRGLVDAHPDLAEELEKLSPEHAAMFVDMVRRAHKKRRIQLAGYLVALVVMVGGTLLSFYAYATREPGEFVGWVLLVPFILVGATLIFFGRWARSQ